MEKTPLHFSDAAYLLDGFERVESVEEFGERLKLGRPLNVKLGIDPTSADLHLGFMVVLHALQRFAESGHNVTLIIGDFTARIGDPSGKKSTRPHLSDEEIEANMQTYREQAGRVLDLERVKIRYNSEWLDRLSHADVVRLAAKCTLAQILERNDFRDRYDAGEAISLHELLYPIAMAYDSVMVEADVELGGIDQLFNLLMGRHYQREFGKLPQICAMVPLLIGLDGVQKMSKSLGNYVGVTEPADVQFGKLMSMPDSLIADYARYAAFRSQSDVDRLRRVLESGEAKPMEEKLTVAGQIVTRYHGREAAERARDFFARTVQRKELPDEMPVREIAVQNASALISSVLSNPGAGLAIESRRDAKRLIQQGSVRIDGVRIADDDSWRWSDPVEVAIGSRRFAKIRVRKT